MGEYSNGQIAQLKRDILGIHAAGYDDADIANMLQQPFHFVAYVCEHPTASVAEVYGYYRGTRKATAYAGNLIRYNGASNKEIAQCLMTSQKWIEELVIR